MDLDLSGRHALVCGASEGIGLAAARELALLGADVTLLARREDALCAARDGLPGSSTPTATDTRPSGASTLPGFHVL